ncbi:MAG: 2-oxo acid dehydrogenase subunit E2 [Bacteroidota bacterium]
MPNIVVPVLGESVVEARVAKWLKKVGDVVAAGDPLVELETEKIDLEVNADSAGIIVSIAHEAGADVKVGEVLGVMDAVDAATAAKAAATAAAAPAPAPAVSDARADVKATPTARNVARAHDVSLDRVPASGPRVTKDDVLRAAAPATAPVTAPAPARVATPAAPSGPRSETRERMTKRRATIARRLVEAQRTAAMLTTFNEVDMSAVMALRERRKEAFQKKHGVGLGFSSFFVKAVVGALKAFPAINAEIQGDEIIYKHYYDIGILLPIGPSLLVPTPSLP